MAAVADDFKHKVFLNDPLQFKTYLYKLVKVITIDNRSYEGWVKTIDPVSETIILINFEGDEPNKINFVLGHAVKSIEIISDNSVHVEKLKRLFDNEKNYDFSADEIAKRRRTLLAWLQLNRFPVQENSTDPDVITVAGVATISSPYGPEQCLCPNEIILGKIQKLIASTPENIADFEPVSTLVKES